MWATSPRLPAACRSAAATDTRPPPGAAERFAAETQTQTGRPGARRGQLARALGLKPNLPRDQIEHLAESLRSGDVLPCSDGLTDVELRGRPGDSVGSRSGGRTVARPCRAARGVRRCVGRGRADGCCAGAATPDIPVSGRGLWRATVGIGLAGGVGAGRIDGLAHAARRWANEHGLTLSRQRGGVRERRGPQRRRPLAPPPRPSLPPRPSSGAPPSPQQDAGPNQARGYGRPLCSPTRRPRSKSRKTMPSFKVGRRPFACSGALSAPLLLATPTL